MSADKKKLGRPPNDERRRGMTTAVSVKADDDLLQALAELTAAVEPTIHVGRQSVAIRRAIFEAQIRLRARSK